MASTDRFSFRAIDGLSRPDASNVKSCASSAGVHGRPVGRGPSFISASSSSPASRPGPSTGYAGLSPSWPVSPQGESGMRPVYNTAHRDFATTDVLAQNAMSGAAVMESHDVQYAEAGPRYASVVPNCVCDHKT